MSRTPSDRQSVPDHFFQGAPSFNPVFEGMSGQSSFGAQFYPSMQPAPNTTTLYFPSAFASRPASSPPLAVNFGACVSDPTNSSPSTASENSENGKDDSSGKPTGRWSDQQTRTLVDKWKENLEDLESSKANETWTKIVEAVNKTAPQKTKKQCKDKIRNLKQAYKEAKSNNKETGRGRKTSPFYDDFDEVLSSRPVMTMPGVLQSIESDEGDDPQESIADSDDDSSESSSPNAGGKGKCKSSSEKGSSKKKARKGKESRDSAFIDLTEKIVEMQSAQMEAMERAQARSEELMLKLEMEQRKLDEKSRQRDQEFFLRMAQLLKK